jgi:hypothetical protein
MSLFDELSAPQATPATMQGPSPGAGEQVHSLAGLFVRNAQGQITHALNGKPLPPQIVATQHVANPKVTNSYFPLSGTIGIELANLLASVADQYAANPAAFGPQAPIPPVVLAAAPQQFAAPPAGMQGWAPAGQQPPPPAAPAPQFQAPVPMQMAPAPMQGSGYQLPQPSPVNPPESIGNPVPPSPAPGQPASSDAPKRRGRPPKNAAAPAPAAPAIVMPAGPAPDMTAIVTMRDPSPKIGDDQRDGGFTILIDAHPMTGFDAEPVDLSHFVKLAGARILADHKVADYAFIDYKGGALLAHYVTEEVRKHLADRDLVLLVSTASRETSQVINTLLPIAGVVVKGVR